METFIGLPKAKQNDVINAALTAFGANGYKKTSVSDIASAAGISKSMVFHYFGTKKALYLYLLKLCGDTMMIAMNERFEKDVTDFFDRVRMAAKIKVSVMEKHPGMLSFLKNAYFETDAQVAEDVLAMLTWGEAFRNGLAMDSMDVSKFKPGVDAALVMKILVCFTEGYISTLPKNKEIDVNQVQREVDACLNLFKIGFYKEEER